MDDTNPCDLCATLEDKALHAILTAHGGTWMCPACASVHGRTTRRGDLVRHPRTALG